MTKNPYFSKDNSRLEMSLGGGTKVQEREKREKRERETKGLEGWGKGFFLSLSLSLALLPFSPPRMREVGWSFYWQNSNWLMSRVEGGGGRPPSPPTPSGRWDCQQKGLDIVHSPLPFLSASHLGYSFSTEEEEEEENETIVDLWGKGTLKAFFAGFEGLSLLLPPSSLSPFLFFPFLKSRKESVGEVKEKTRAKNPLRPQSETKPLFPFEMGRLATAHKHLKKALKRQKRF